MRKSDDVVIPSGLHARDTTRTHSPPPRSTHGEDMISSCSDMSGVDAVAVAIATTESRRDARVNLEHRVLAKMPVPWHILGPAALVGLVVGAGLFLYLLFRA